MGANMNQNGRKWHDVNWRRMAVIIGLCSVSALAPRILLWFYEPTLADCLIERNSDVVKGWGKDCTIPSPGSHPVVFFKKNP